MSAAVLAWPGAIAIGLSLGLLGSGGSILTVPVLVYLLGQDEKIAIAGSLGVVGTVALVASLQYLRSGQIDGRAVLLFGVPGTLGAYLGAWSAVLVPGIVQLSLFAIVMLIAAWLMFRPPRLEPAEASAPRPALKIAVDGLAVGALTGLVGVGGGFLIVPALVLLGGLSMHRAVATSLVIIAMKSFSGFWKYLEVLDAKDLSLDWSLLGLVTVLAVGGSIAGGQLAKRLPQERLRRIFAVFLLLMGIYILARSLPQAINFS